MQKIKCPECGTSRIRVVDNFDSETHEHVYSCVACGDEFTATDEEEQYDDQKCKDFACDAAPLGRSDQRYCPNQTR